jgi:hypothetical protein
MHPSVFPMEFRIASLPHRISNSFPFPFRLLLFFYSSKPDEGMTERRMARRVLRAHPVERA